MEKPYFQEMISYCLSQGYIINGKIIDPEKLVFEERVKMNCFYCGKYNSCWKCPPKIPDIDFQKMLREYDNVALVYHKYPLEKQNYDIARVESSVQLHRALLMCEKWLWEHNNSTALSFIGGSCKLCKTGCAPNKCVNPYQARSPVEGLGINVIKSAEQFGIHINFPPEQYMMRIGLLLW